MNLFQNRIQELKILNSVSCHESSRMILSYFNDLVPNTPVEDAMRPKSGQTLIVKDYVKFAVELAEQSR